MDKYNFDCICKITNADKYACKCNRINGGKRIKKKNKNKKSKKIKNHKIINKKRRTIKL